MDFVPDSLKKKDFSDELRTLMAETEAQSTINLEQTINDCFAFEKKCRVAGDTPSLKAICVHIVSLCRNREDWARLNSSLTTINKRRNQSKNAIIGSVEVAMSYVDTVVWPDQAAKVAFLTTLKDVCEGKMYVEAESARLHLFLAKIHETNGDIGAACDMIQDVHVETFGSLSKKEKADYILEQIRLNLARKDFIRSLIQSRKMNRKTIEEDGFEDVKSTFYSYMIEYHTQEKDAWEICNCYYKLYEVALKQSMKEVASDALKSCILHLVLSKYDIEQVDMMHRIKKLTDDNKEGGMEVYHSALVLFTTKEIIAYPFEGQDALEANPSLGSGPTGGDEVKNHFLKTFHARIIEHNIRVVATYYTSVRVSRLCTLINISQDELETFLSDMFASGDIAVKIDRPAGVINFSSIRPTEAILSDWSSDITKVLNMIESTSHLINRENMIYKV